MTERIFLIGFRGTGKTTIARLLAERLAWPWCDADQVLEQRYGKTIRQIFDDEGEAKRRGRESWKELFERSEDYVRRQLALFKGKHVAYNENGILAAFDGPARAIRCATAITDSARRLGVQVRTGLHTGECDVIGDAYSGFAVELAKKIAEESAEGNILVSRTVKDLVAGSGLKFKEHGVRSFDGVEGEWRLFMVDK